MPDPKHVHDLAESTQVALTDYVESDIAIGPATYASKKVTRQNLLGQMSATMPLRATVLPADLMMLEWDDAGTPTIARTPLSSLPFVSLAGKMKWVDGSNGNDATGTPYATIAAAKAAASSGDTIVVGPGTYDECDLLKNGVNYFFLPGATVLYTGGASGTALFKDAAGAPCSCTIGGWGRFIWNGTDAGSSVLKLVEASSQINFQFDSVETNAGNAPTIWVPADATLVIVKGNKIIAGHDITALNGLMKVDVTYIDGDVSFGGTGLEIYIGTVNGALTATGTGDFWIGKITDVAVLSDSAGMTFHDTVFTSVVRLSEPALTVIMDACVFLYNAGTYSIYVDTGESATLKVHRQCIANLGVDPAITFTVGAARFIVDATI